MDLPNLTAGKRFTLPRPPLSADALLLAANELFCAPLRWGRAVVACYDRCSPWMVRWLAERPRTRAWVRRWLDVLVRRIA